MRKMLVPITLVLLGGLAAASNWVRFFEGRDTTGRETWWSEYDTESISSRAIWTKNHCTANCDKHGANHDRVLDYLKVRYLTNCSDRYLKQSQRREYYTDGDSADVPDIEWSSADPDSIAEAIYKRACAK
jgi:hypothetical protein